MLSDTLKTCLATGAVVAGLAAAPTLARAQAALPTAPAADRTANGGTTSAAASLPGDGGSPLEPYLVTWLLPISGLLAAGAGVAVDRRMRVAR